MGRWPMLALAAAMSLSGSAGAQESCARAGDGFCDEPYIGTGICPLNGDPADCADREIFWNSDDEFLVEEQLFEQPPEKLRLGRNEIFARHGYRFQSEALQTWFGYRSWYQPADGEVELSAVEQANVELINEEERAQAAGEPHPTGMPRPRGSFTGTYAYADGTRFEVERIDGAERMLQIDPDGHERLRLYRNGSHEMWDPRPDEGYVTVYSVWYDPYVLLRQPALLVQLAPVFEAEETVEGERLLRFRLTMENEYDEFWRGLVWVTPDGLVARADVTLRWYEGEPEQTIRFELEDLRRESIDPARLAPPEDLEVMFAG